MNRIYVSPTFESNSTMYNFSKKPDYISDKKEYLESKIDHKYEQ